jgi:hypothetical protein
MNCKAKTKGGSPCRMKAIQGQRYCFTHDPEQAQARAKARKLGGERNRTPHGGSAAELPSKIRTMDDLRAVYDYTLAEIIPMENSIPRARLLLAIVEQGIKLFEVGEIEQRLAALESMRST